MKREVLSVWYDGLGAIDWFFLDTQEVNASLLKYNDGRNNTPPVPVVDTIWADNAIPGDAFTSLVLESGGTTVIPEPATLGMMAIAGLGMFLARKKTRR